MTPGAGWIRDIKLIRSRTLFAAALLTVCLPVEPPTRLLGLERLYFTHVASPGKAFVASQAVTAALPLLATSTFADCKTTHADPQDPDIEILVCDFPLLPGNSRNLFVRQVIRAVAYSRISDVWWALYDHQKRTDVWYFNANPDRTENKALYNYRIGAVSTLADGTLRFRVHGEMFRPQGAWWISEKIFTFAPRGGAFDCSQVDTEFTISRGYDLGVTKPAITFSSERRTDSRIEIRTSEGVPDEVLKTCGFLDPTSQEAGEIDWRAMATVTACILQKTPARVTYRRLTEASFVERGGK